MGICFPCQEEYASINAIEIEWTLLHLMDGPSHFTAINARMCILQAQSSGSQINTHRGTLHLYSLLLSFLQGVNYRSLSGKEGQLSVFQGKDMVSLFLGCCDVYVCHMRNPTIKLVLYELFPLNS